MSGGPASGVNRLDISNQDVTLASFGSDALASLARVRNGVQYVYLWLPTGSAQLQGVISNELLFAGSSTPSRIDINIDPESPVIIGPPLRGGNWVAVNNSNYSNHRRTIHYFDGQERNVQQFAIDWAKLDNNLRAASGNGSRNQDHYAYGQEVLAVRDGVVAGLRDGMAENPRPGVLRYQNPTTEELAGNWVLLDMGNNQYAMYAHLIPGSIAVEVGQRVSKGDVLGRVGNSGNSTAPHLHFHVAEVFDTQHASAANGSGLGYVFESFSTRVEDFDGSQAITHEVPHYVEYPAENVLLSFPGPTPSLNTAVDSQAVFRGSATDRGTNTDSDLFSRSATIDVSFSVGVAPEDIGRSGSFFVVAQHDGSFYLKTNGQFVPWDMNFSSLLPMESYHVLQAEESIDVISGLTDLPGSFVVYAGYSNEAGDFHYNTVPLTFTVLTK